MDQRKTRKSLEKILEEREDNLVRLSFDRVFAKASYPQDKKDELDRLDEEVKKIQKEIEKERMKPKKLRDIEKLIKFEDILTGKAEKIGLRIKRDDLKQMFDRFEEQVLKNKDSIKIELKMIEKLRDYIKNPQQIYEE